MTKSVSRAERIDADYYDRSEYFASGHLTDRQSPFQRYRVEKVLSIYDPAPDERVLDLGCGWGTFAWTLGPRVAEVVGVDFSAKSVELCERQRKSGGFRNVRFVHADAGATGMAPESFDLVIAADLFEHLYPDDSERVAREAHRVLKTGGHFSIWTPHRGHLLEIAGGFGLLFAGRRDTVRQYGAMIMGICGALYEEKIADPQTGRLLNPNMETYKLAGIGDIGRLQVHMMTGPGYDERGPVGLGEPPANSPIAAISNAVANAIGVRVQFAPFTPDRVLGALDRGGRA